jgi:cell filamentation protein
MYDAVVDPYCYPGATVLKNIPDLRSQDDLDAYEALITLQRADEPLPAGRFSLSHYRAIHRHLFQDVYAWAGAFRTVRMSKDGSAFCYPEHIQREMTSLFSWLRQNRRLQHRSRDQFAIDAAWFLSTLNAIHRFREGNGRTQTLFLTLVAERADHPLDLDRLAPEAWMAAMIESFGGSNEPLVEQVAALLG